MCSLQIARPNSAIQAIVRLVCQADHLVNRLELCNAQHWSKDLIAPDLHLSSHIPEDCWLDEVSLPQVRVRGLLPSTKQLGPLFHTVFDVCENCFLSRF